jgi:hypothetical protein
MTFARLHSTTPRRRSRAHARRWRLRSAPPPRHLPTSADATAARVRAAGGPTDEARYSCACGLQFLASVSTTVACPHCGATQPW